MSQSQSPPIPCPYMDKNEIGKLLGISGSTVDRLVRVGTLPRPLLLGSRVRRWERAAVMSKLTQLAAPQDQEEE